jgi:hypothetical protein
LRRIIVTAIALAVASPAFAGGFSGGFGGGFAQGFGNAIEMGNAMAQMDAAKAQTEANSPAGQCLAVQTTRIMHQKRMPTPSVARSQMDAARAYCNSVFGG